jgi:hypothetical protein
LARRECIVGGRKKWHLLGGRVQLKETVEITLKRVAFAKNNLKIELSYPSLEDSFVGFHDDSKRGSREQAIRIVGGETKPGAKAYTVRGFSEAEVRKL